MAKEIGPYIGVTGFMHRVEVEEALVEIPPWAKRRLMVGVLMSSKTLTGQTNKWPGRFPKIEAVADIFIKHPQVLNLIHYSTDDSQTLGHQLVQITKLVGPDNFDGFQLNVPWPDPCIIRNYQHEGNGLYPDKTVVLQMGSKTLGENPKHFGTALRCAYDHRSCCTWEPDAILIDPSSGTGKPMDPAKMAEYLRVVRRQHFPNIGIGAAGGLGPDTMHLIKPLMEEFPDLSWDAEGCLRIPRPEDQLDLLRMKRYLRDSFALEQSGHDAFDL